MRKVYVLIGKHEPDTWVSGVFTSMRKAIKYRNILIKKFPYREYKIETEVLI